MRKKLFLFLIASSIGLSGSPKADPASDAIVKDGGTITEAANGWIVICIGGQRNELGEIDIPAHCRLEKQDFISVIEINRQGTKLRTNPIDVPCEMRTQKAAVDGRQIHKLRVASQIAALSNGKKFARSATVYWLECRDEIESTSLFGFSAAYPILRRNWAAYNNALKNK